jgi:hypothetical protein
MLETALNNQMLVQADERAKLCTSLQRAAEYARQEATTQLKMVSGLCTKFAAGSHHDRDAFEAVSREAHLAAFALMTYGQTVQALHILGDGLCDDIIAAGQQIQQRALEHEQKYLANSLSPSEVFYDDLYAAEMLSHSHASVLASRGFGIDAINPDVEAVNPAIQLEPNPS